MRAKDYFYNPHGPTTVPQSHSFLKIFWNSKSLFKKNIKITHPTDRRTILKEILVFWIHGLWLRGVANRGIRADNWSIYSRTGDIIWGWRTGQIQLIFAIVLCFSSVQLGVAGAAVEEHVFVLILMILKLLFSDVTAIAQKFCKSERGRNNW